MRSRLINLLFTPILLLTVASEADAVGIPSLATIAWKAHCEAPVKTPGEAILRNVRCRLAAIRTQPTAADTTRLPGEGLDCMKANEKLKAPEPRMIDMQLQICLDEVTKKAEQRLTDTTNHHRRQMRRRDRFSAIIVLLDEVANGITSFDEKVAAQKGGGPACYQDEASLRACVERVEEQANVIGSFDIALAEIHKAGRDLLPDVHVPPPNLAQGAELELPLKDESVLPAFPKFLLAVQAQKTRVKKLREAFELAVLGPAVKK